MILEGKIDMFCQSKFGITFQVRIEDQLQNQDKKSPRNYIPPVSCYFPIHIGDDEGTIDVPDMNEKMGPWIENPGTSWV